MDDFLRGAVRLFFQEGGDVDASGGAVGAHEVFALRVGAVFQAGAAAGIGLACQQEAGEALRAAEGIQLFQQPQ